MEAEIITGIGTILGIAGTLLLRDFRDGKNLIRKNNPIFPDVAYLKNYYNHDLTAILTELQVDQKQGFRDMAAAQKEITEALIRIESGGIKIRI